MSFTIPAVANYIGGRWVSPTGREVEATDPSTGKVVTTFQVSDDDQVEEAIGSARRAFDEGAWRDWTPTRRSKALYELADAIEADTDRLVPLLVHDIGSPVSAAKASQLDSAVQCLRWFAEAALRGPSGGYKRPLPTLSVPGGLSTSMIVNEPAGVVAALTAYNYPPLLLARKLGGALAAGCTTVVLPSLQGQLVASRLCELISELDLPPGVVNFVVGEAAAGHMLSTDPRVDLVSFTGSEQVGAAILAQGSPTIKRTVLELGGKSPNLLLESADIPRLISATMARVYSMAGQACGANTRILVPESKYEEFVEAARAELAGVVVGDASDPRTQIGPVISASQLDRVKGFVERAVCDGGVVAAETPLGADTASAPGFYLPAMLVSGLSSDSELAQEETFGPVGVLLPYRSINEAVSLANDSRFTLNANIWGKTSDALEIAPRIQAGTVTINGGGGMRQDASWGGWRSSGLGREGGERGFLEFFTEKHVQWLADS